jgi:hypothetical protein
MRSLFSLRSSLPCLLHRHANEMQCVMLALAIVVVVIREVL